MIQYGEDQDVRARDDPEISEEQEDFMEKQMRELGIQWKYLFTVKCHYETFIFVRMFLNGIWKYYLLWITENKDTAFLQDTSKFMQNTASSGGRFRTF